MQQINLLWLDINASFSHSSLALPALHAQCQNQEWNRQIKWNSITASINTNLSLVITQILQHKPDIIAATSWLFTSDYLLAILQRVKTLCPHVTIVLGGPEFLGNNEIFLSQHNYISAVFRGEGEIVFPQWLQAYIKTNKQTFEPNYNDSVIDGLCYIDSIGVYHDNGIAKVQDYDQLAFSETSPFFCKTKAFVQLETTRGCFNTCAFCVSGADKPVRSLSLDSIKKRLDMYAEWGVENVRLLDRTFNGSSKRAIELLLLFEKYKEKLAFHLEIHPAYLNEEVRTKLQTMPKGLLHLEAGIQSLREDVLAKSDRIGDLSKAIDGLSFLGTLENIETHLDLIAGLPGYTLQAIKEDIQSLARFNADEIQLETLKLLPGTKMRNNATSLGLKHSSQPPYEILESDSMSYSELCKAMQYSRVIDLFYNAKQWQMITRYLLLLDLDFIEHFTNWLDAKGVLQSLLSIEKRGLLLYEYCAQFQPQLIEAHTLAWIEADLTLKKYPIKNLRRWMNEIPLDSIVLRGSYSSEMYLYHLKNCMLELDKIKEVEIIVGIPKGITTEKQLFIARLNA